MPKFIVEREMPHAAALSVEDLKGIARVSCAIPRRWVPPSSGSRTS
jgi:hypothetical protein